MAVCSVCGKALNEIEPCPYNYRHGPTCDECCEACYKNEPFPCPEHDTRTRKQNTTYKENSK